MIAALLISAFLSNGVTCNGAPVATSTAVTPRFNVSVCVTHDVPLCGITYRLRPDTLGTMRINTRTPGPHFDDPTQAIVLPRTIVHETAGDWGATLSGFVPVAPGTKRLVATYNITVLGSKPDTSYGFSLDPISQVTIDPNGRCGLANPGERPPPFTEVLLPAAHFILKKGTPK